jgi:regulator of replication initiation timing
VTPCEAEAVIAAAQEENAALYHQTVDLRVENEKLRRQLSDARDPATAHLTDVLLIDAETLRKQATERDALAAENADLIDKVTAITQQRDDARALVVRSGYFQTEDDDALVSRPYDDGGPVCLPCRNGDHSQHQPTLADACIGCACEVMR